MLVVVVVVVARGVAVSAVLSDYCAHSWVLCG
jgi:hypothetical protein